MRLFTRSNFSVLCDTTMIAAMFEQLRHANPRESGGLLIGLINFKREVIYVMRLGF